MEPRSRTLGQVAARVAGPLGRLTTVLIGFVLTMVGLAMTVTIVMLPVGVAIGLAGFAILLCGIFAPPMSTDG